MKTTRKSSIKNERGQALILITFAIIGMIGLVGLTVDGGRVYSERRHAQNAADSAAYTAALKYVNYASNDDMVLSAKDIAIENGYTGDLLNNSVDVTWVDSPSSVDCFLGNRDITVTIESKVDTTFAAVVGIRQMNTKVVATTRACKSYTGGLFGENAIVGLNPSTTHCAYNSGESETASWNIFGGGIFSNGCAYSKNDDAVVLYDGACVSAVVLPPEDMYTCSTQGSPIPYPEGILGMMPPNPCDGTAGDIGKPQPAVEKDKGVESVELKDGVYCITDFDDYDSTFINLDNATLYVTDTDFDVTFAGGGGFSGSPTELSGFTGSEPYQGYYMVIAYVSPPCQNFTDNGSQRVQYRGNGGAGSQLSGTVFAPSACIDFRGNPGGDAVDSQIIGYNISSNGNAAIWITYDDNDNHVETVEADVQLFK